MAHSKEEVQEYIIDRLDNWFEDMDTDTEEYDLLSKAYDNIQTDCMLTKEQAKALHNRIENEARVLTQMHLTNANSFLLELDSLSIYPEIWAQYCRPGTYRIVFTEK